MLCDRFFINNHNSDLATTADCCVVTFRLCWQPNRIKFPSIRHRFSAPQLAKSHQPSGHGQHSKFMYAAPSSLKATRKLIKLENNKSKAEQNRTEAAPEASRRRRMWMWMWMWRIMKHKKCTSQPAGTAPNGGHGPRNRLGIVHIYVYICIYIYPQIYVDELAKARRSVGGHH